MNGWQLSRRSVLLAGAAAGSTATFARLHATTIHGEVPWAPDAANAPTSVSPGPYQFFSAAEASFVDAAVSRLIPNDDLGPGAREAGVTPFLDRQLAGAYGRAERWYMQGPWSKGTESQGYQTRFAPKDFYRTAIGAIDGHCRQSYGDKAFADLSPPDQDRVLTGLEKGTVELGQVDAKAFFKLFLQNTIEGFFSDPIYGGNRNMAGWRLIGFPGARYDYRDYVGKHGVRLDLQPVGLKGGPSWSS